jgi:hypothetical protein
MNRCWYVGTCSIDIQNGISITKIVRKHCMKSNDTKIYPRKLRKNIFHGIPASILLYGSGMSPLTEKLGNKIWTVEFDY